MAVKNNNYKQILIKINKTKKIANVECVKARWMSIIIHEVCTEYKICISHVYFCTLPLEKEIYLEL